MITQTRHYKVAGLTFGVEVSEPFSFMDYTAPVRERIRLSAEGQVVPIKPTRAGDDVPPRTLIQHKSELPEGYTNRMLDFSQYEPFFTEDSSEEIFHLTVTSPIDEDQLTSSLEGFDLLLRVDDSYPYYNIYKKGDETAFAYEGEGDKVVSVLKIGAGAATATYSPIKGGRGVLYNLSTSLMILFTYASARHDAVLMHSSVIRHGGNAKMFLGKSGTGKSTHSRLWLENIPGAELLNDDNPAIRIEDGVAWVYGTPWSGKTPCYRNDREKIGAIVSLNQAPRNSIEPIKGLMAYTKLIASASSVRWERKMMDGIVAVLSNVAMNVPCFEMDCLPDADAAIVCQSGVE